MNAGSTHDRVQVNTNRWETRQMVTMAILVALGTLISFIDIPIIPGVDWLKYDPSSVAMLIGAFVYGPLAGAVIGTLIALIHWSSAGIWGVVMNIVAMLAMGVPAGLIYRRRRTRRSAVVALAVASVVMVVVNLLANLVVTPIYTGMPVAAVAGLILPVLLPFNVIKAILNSVITLLVYKSVSRMIKPERKQPLCDTPVQDTP
ncbi:MAG: ECF transporter S component [Coriobacteriia bacterium]|nr:ECF transporter S component [Coriobacteriia bacterium]